MYPRKFANIYYIDIGFQRHDWEKNSSLIINLAFDRNSIRSLSRHITRSRSKIKQKKGDIHHRLSMNTKILIILCKSYFKFRKYRENYFNIRKYILNYDILRVKISKSVVYNFCICCG